MATLEDVDFEDIGGTNDDSIEEPNDDRRETNKEGQSKKKVRGKDIPWKEYKNFDTAEVYKQSDFKQEIEDGYTCNRRREWEYGSVEVHQCKYQRRAGYLACPWQLKVTYKSNS